MENLVWEKIDKVNTLELAKISYKVVEQPTVTHKNLAQTHEEEKIELILVLTGAFGIWYAFG